MLQYVPVVYKAGVTVGTTVATSSVSANVAIPVDATGNNPRRIMLSSTAAAHVRLCSTSATTATTGDLMIGVHPLCIDSSGAAYVAYIQDSATGNLNIAPVES